MAHGPLDVGGASLSTVVLKELIGKDAVQSAVEMAATKKAIDGELRLVI
ncbi:MAG: hypothetical protein IPL79_00325 [Myxococcales bacterium]|nr:hypothetical protein [Myxococcales bacterium]